MAIHATPQLLWQCIDLVGPVPCGGIDRYDLADHQSADDDFSVVESFWRRTLVANVTEGFNEVWKLSKALTDAGLKLDYIEQESESLERSFIELTEGSVS